MGEYFTHKFAHRFGFIERGKRLITFNYPGSKVTGSGGINDRGIAVGAYLDAAGSAHGWVRSVDGKLRRLDDPSAASGKGLGTQALGINDAGVIVGYYEDKHNDAHGFIYNPTSGFRTVDAPGAGTRSGQGTLLEGINDAGVIVGEYLDANNVYHGFVYSQRSFFTYDAPGAGTKPGQGTFPEGISRDGTIVGNTVNAKNASSGWLLSGWHFTALNDPLGANGTDVFGINQRGDEACGDYVDASGKLHGFVARLPSSG